MELGSLGVLKGMSKEIDYVSKDQREFAQMENLEKEIAKDQQANMMAQELEAKQYEEISNKAAEMLGPDRAKIQSKSLELQKTIRSKIEEYGSRKAFFENGGISLLSKYKSDLLNSTETLSYLDNKKNMESLMKIMSDGKGHLISDIDKQNLDNYNKGIGDGKITYSGMKSEVTIPEKYYNYGEDVPVEVILKSNYLAVYNNWALDNPKLVGLTGEALNTELKAYTAQHYYGQGTNMLKYQQDLAESLAKKQAKAMSSAGTGNTQEDNDVSFIAEMNDAFVSGREIAPMNINSVMSDKNYIVNMASKNKGLGSLAGKILPYNDYTSNYTSAEGWFDSPFKKLGKKLNLDDKYKVASGAIVPVKMTKNLIEYLYPGSENVNSINVKLNQSEFYSPNGEFLKKDFVDAQNDKPMRLEGMIYGFIDGQGKLVTQILNRKGEPYAPDSEEIKDHKRLYSGELSQAIFTVLVDSDGNKIYQKQNSNSLIGESSFNEAIGASNNISAEKRQRDKKAFVNDLIIQNANWNKGIVRKNVIIAGSPGGIFSTPELTAEMRMTERPGGVKRYELVKAYYMALSAMTERDLNGTTGDYSANTMLKDGYYKGTNEFNFSRMVNYSPKIKDALKSSNYDDIGFINFVGTITSAGDPEHEASNQKLIQNWIKFYNILKK